MTQAVSRILTAVEELSPSELAELRRAIVERTQMTDDLSEDDFGTLAAEMFSRLDDEEATTGA
jgi:hypothetical protein